MAGVRHQHGGRRSTHPGQVVGTLGGAPTSRKSSAFVWDPSSGLRALGKLAGTGTFNPADPALTAAWSPAPRRPAMSTSGRPPSAGPRQERRTPGAGRLYININNAGKVVGYTLGPAGALGRAAKSKEVRLAAVHLWAGEQQRGRQIVGNASGGGPAQLFDERTGWASFPLPERRHRTCLRHQRPGTRDRELHAVHHAGQAELALRTARRSLAPSSGATAGRRRSGRTSATAAASTTTTKSSASSSPAPPDFAPSCTGTESSATSTGSSATATVLEDARAINDAGWIVANGNDRAFMLIDLTTQRCNGPANRRGHDDHHALIRRDPSSLTRGKHCPASRRLRSRSRPLRTSAYRFMRPAQSRATALQGRRTGSGARPSERGGVPRAIARVAVRTVRQRHFDEPLICVPFDRHMEQRSSARLDRLRDEVRPALQDQSATAAWPVTTATASGGPPPGSSCSSSSAWATAPPARRRSASRSPPPAPSDVTSGAGPGATTRCGPDPAIENRPRGTTARPRRWRSTANAQPSSPPRRQAAIVRARPIRVVAGRDTPHAHARRCPRIRATG